jgi:two-component system cell cycle sensor histidine kinase/response regulator CckA
MRTPAPPLRPRPRHLRSFLLGLALAAAAPAADLPLVTDPSLLWSMPTEQKAMKHPVRLEGRINYFDPGFKLLWMEKDGVSTFVQVSASPPPLRNGQRVVIEGTMVPNRGLEASEVTVRVLHEREPIEPLATRGRINDLELLHSRMVVAEAYVDSQQTIDAEHERLILVVENRPVICWVRPDDPARVPDWRGQMVRVTGLYSGRFDPTKTRITIELWVGDQAAIEVRGPLAESARFRQNVTPINEIFRQPPGAEVLVRGQVERHEPGQELIIRDATGEVKVETVQSQRLAPGTRIEAVGRVEEKDRWIIGRALYRTVAPDPPQGEAGRPEVLVRIADILALGQAEVAKGRPVALTGMVTWSLPESDHLFLLDATGGIRVRYDRAKTGVIAYGKYFTVKGVTRPGPNAPMIELETYVDLGAMSHPAPRPLTLEQARTGRHDGEWVELRGFLRHTRSEGDWRWIHVTTPAGEFVGHLQSPVNFVANPGALISMRGVCDLQRGADGRPEEVRLRVPFLHDITIEEEAPANYYDVPRRALEDLDQIGATRGLLRVRVTGTVAHAVPGRLLYLEEGAVGLLVQSEGREPLQPGDLVEAVGILGREGDHTILREAVYRRTGRGDAPTPQTLTDPAVFDPAADFRLVRARGHLLDVLHTAAYTRLTLQHHETLFEARFDHTAEAWPAKMSIGAELELTGIYKLTYNDNQQPRGFELYLRGPADMVVVRPAPVLDLRRALIVVGALAACVLLGLAWIYSLRRRVQRQTAQIRTQWEQQARIEAGMQQAARLESLGVLAGGIAHDFNNLLTVIMGNLSLMKLNPAVAESEARPIAAIERGTARAGDLARQLLTFASGGEPLRAPVDLAAITTEASGRSLRGTEVQTELTAEPGLWAADGDRDQLMQAVQHLLQNAAQAMPRGGVVRLRLTNETREEAGRPGLKPGRYIRLTVADQGEGISAEALPRVFDPYFTTRKGARGLGLATAYSIVTRHGGRIEVASKPGQGTTFSLWLPAAAAPGPQPVPEPLPDPPAGGTPRVLIMDDETSVAEIAAAVLARIGLEPMTVPDGARALQEFKAARDGGRPFALVILDLTIPGGMGGRETIEAIRQIDPHVPAIVSSGYSSDPVMAHFRAHGFHAVVPKPYDVATLAEKVRQLVPAAKKL